MLAKKMRVISAMGLLMALALALLACAKPAAKAGELDVAVFVPGVVSGSPIYELLVAGARQAIAEVPNATVKVVEAGYNQAEWLDKLTAIAETGEFELIVSSNPALPDLCATVARDYPQQRFFIADAYLQGNPAIHTVLYNQQEQGFLVGYLAAAYTASQGDGKVVGLVAAQSYPTLDRLIIPGFTAGLKSFDPAFRLEYREIGNWYDANKAAELAGALFDQGIQVVLPIAGGAGQGVIAAATERGRKIVWFDGDGYKLAPGTVIGCAELAQDRLVAEKVKQLLTKPASLYGTAEIVGYAQGYIRFNGNSESYRQLAAPVRDAFEQAMSRLEQGQPDFSLKGF